MVHIQVLEKLCLVSLDWNDLFTKKYDVIESAPYSPMPSFNLKRPTLSFNLGAKYLVQLYENFIPLSIATQPILHPLTQLNPTKAPEARHNLVKRNTYTDERRENPGPIPWRSCCVGNWKIKPEEKHSFHAFLLKGGK